ncbi:CoA pyrophosphatase [Alteromonas sp. ASW11-36]|uniref:CoA pyrophosphatase n=1 Tax=Alteromonas arenosi TaxID=3055817 RepID=A0ABT7SZK9_9ALTE|nr:CoA pyrophosphatase [Alteromonas sp. ASW11-36]MDM7860987.1 CoA pyrophosphatase [Alteromonas sp. ASW11-36]
MTEAEFLARLHHVRQVASEADYPLRVAGKPAGVLVPLVNREQGLQILLTRRALHLRHHPGQISFPGGRQEASDADAVEAALRETEEEIGICRAHVDVIGQLPAYRTISGYAMVPVLGFVKPDLPLHLDKNEVEDAFEVPLNYALDKQNHFIHWIERQNYRHPIYFIPFEDTYIWGATAAILRTLANHIHAD